MNKYEFKLMLKDLAHTNGIKFIKDRPELRKQWNDLISSDKDWQSGAKSDEEAQYDAMYKLFDIDGALQNVDPRSWVAYINSIKSGNTPDTILWDFYVNNRDVEDIHSDMNGAKDIYPHQMAGQENNQNFYRIGHNDAWFGTQPFVDGNKQPDPTRGLYRILHDYDISKEEFYKLLADETNKRKNEEIWDMDNPENWKDYKLGGLIPMDLSGNGMLDKFGRWAIGGITNSMFGETINDYKSGRAQKDPDYGWGGISPWDIGFATADVVTSPFGVGKGSLAKKIVGGTIGLGSDVAIPVAKEVHNSTHNGTDINWSEALGDIGLRLGSRAALSAGEGIFKRISDSSKDIAPGVSNATGKIDDIAHAKQRVDDKYNVFMNDLDNQAYEQTMKEFHPDMFGNTDAIVIAQPRKAEMLPQPSPYDEMDVFKFKEDAPHSLNADEYVNADNFGQYHVSNKDGVIEPVRDVTGNPVYYNKLDRDARDMEYFINLKNNPEEGAAGLNIDHIKRIRELQAKYPEFKEKYSFVDNEHPVLGFALRTLDDVIVEPRNLYTRLLTSDAPEQLDIDGMKYNVQDMAKITELYNNIPAETRKAIEAGDYSLASEYDRKIANKYFELLSQQPYQVNFR